MTQASSDSLQKMLKQPRDAIDANRHLQEQTQAEINSLEVQEAETSRQMDATRRRLALRRSEFADYLRRTYKYQPDLLDSIFESKGISDFLTRAAAFLQVRNYGDHLLHNIKDAEQRLNHEAHHLRADPQTALN